MRIKNYSFPYYTRLDRILIFLKLNFVIDFKNWLKTTINLKKNASKEYRCLEIGPGLNRIDGFETVNIIDGKNVDYIMDVSEKLDFEDAQFDIIYASHILEHVPWFLQKKVFAELFRILKTNGVLEVWVPDGGKIMGVLQDYENDGVDNTGKDGWYRLNSDRNVHTWVNGRIFSYGDETANPNSFNWHRTLFTKKSLISLFEGANFSSIVEMDHSQVRGFDHGWINLGVKGVKK